MTGLEKCLVAAEASGAARAIAGVSGEASYSLNKYLLCTQSGL